LNEDIFEQPDMQAVFETRLNRRTPDIVIDHAYFIRHTVIVDHTVDQNNLR